MVKTVSALALVAFALAGCGGGSGTASKTTTTTSPGSSARLGTQFGTATISGLGTVVVDARGRTVYVLTSGAKKNAPCTAANGCTAVWPDMPLPNGTTAAKAGAGLDASLLGTMKVGGKTYPTYNGYLMYAYSRDDGPLQANGEEANSFGGTWYALSAAGVPLKWS